MPCYETESEKLGYAIKTEYSKCKDEFLLKPASNEWLTGALCAILTELEIVTQDYTVFRDFIDKAETNGSINFIRQWFAQHKSNDETRLKKMPKEYNFSKHELVFIKNRNITLNN